MFMVLFVGGFFVVVLFVFCLFVCLFLIFSNHLKPASISYMFIQIHNIFFYV